MRPLQVAVALLLAPAALAQRPIVEIKVTGNERLAPAAVIAASGLRTGQAVTRAELDRAAQKLFETGFFKGVNYRYDPKADGGVAGYAVTLEISEEAARTPVELDIPGLDVERLWPQLKAADGFIDRQMPNNDRATDYYKRVIETTLRKSNHPEEVAVKTEADLHNGKMVVIYRPANLPKIAAIRFDGNAAIADGALEAAMAKVAVGQDYSERDFRRMLDFNVRPLYEELGRLTVAFPSVRMADAGNAAVAITAGIDEGPVWRLGKVVLTGDVLPLADMHDAARFAYGAPANWKQFGESVSVMEKVLRRDGYITVSSKPVRLFHEPPLVVDVNVEVRKGPQFLFGELHIQGLDAGTEQRLAALWKLPKGAPINPFYIDDFFHSVQPSLRGKFKTFRSELHVHKDANVVDVTLMFR